MRYLMKFEVLKPDYVKSPYSGMTKEHWIEAGCFLLEGIFRHVKSIEQPIVVPRQEVKISYPQPGGPAWRKAAERFEGLARSFLLAAPVLHNRPDQKIGGYSLRSYYKNQIIRSITPGTESYFMTLNEIRESEKDGEKAFQHTCECASLVIGLTQCKEVIWDTYTQEEKDHVAAYLSEFGHSDTGHHNWRLFNMLILGFLHREGYEVDKEIIRDHASVILSYYAGDGWYRDGHLFDYYCAWAFQVYGPLWNEWYGYQEEPYIAAKIEAYANDFVKTFPQMFGEGGKVIMWGRSSTYRSAAAAPLAANFLLQNPSGEPGLSRRIASASLLQFVTKEECFYEGIPCLGFYGPFSPMVQSYSCAASPFWMANTFVCLCLPDEHPFWTETEREIDFGDSHGDVKETLLEAPGILVSNDHYNKMTQLRTGKILMGKEHPSINAYVRLSFHSDFPWEDFDKKGAEAMQYSLTYGNNTESHYPNLLMWAGVRDGILYRKEYFDFISTFQNQASIDLADFPVPYGIVRVDRARIPQKPYLLTLGAYGMPKEQEVFIERRSKVMEGKTVEAILVKSQRGQIAFVNYQGLEELTVKTRKGVNAICEESVLLYGKQLAKHKYAYENYMIISVILTRVSQEEFTDKELFPIEQIRYEDPEQKGGYGPIHLQLFDHSVKKIDFEGMESKLQI